MGLILGVSLFLMRHQYARMLSTNEEVIDIATEAYIFSSISHVLDFIYGV